MLDLYTLKQKTTPQEFASDLLSRGPLFWSELNRFWVITDHALAQKLLRHPLLSADRSRFFQTQLSACPFHKISRFLGMVKNMMVHSDGSIHAQRRKLAQSGLTDHVLNRLGNQIVKVVRHLVESMTKETEIEFVTRIALPLPNIILADLFSIPSDQREDFYRWSHHMTQFFGGGSKNILSDAEKAEEGATQLHEFFTRMIALRDSTFQNDFIGHLVHHRGDLDEQEIISQAAIMLIAGSITTTDQICNNLYGLLTSGTWPQLLKNPTLIEPAIEEATRLDPAVTFIFRSATESFCLEEKWIKKGDLIFISNHAANRNENIFPKAHEFVPDRHRNPHLSYGSGAHYCLGARLGRLLMRELFSQLLQKHPNLSLHPQKPSIRKHQSLGFSGFENLHLILGEL